jgi:hypothetical protein
MSESERFTPSLKQALFENGLVGLAALVLLPLIFRARRHPPWSVAIGLGVAGSFLIFLFYTCRFLWRAPRGVRFSDSTLVIEQRNRRDAEILWSNILRAKHTSSGGLKWRLWTADSVFEVRDDGFSLAQWNKISQIISEQLAARNIPITTAVR